MIKNTIITGLCVVLIIMLYLKFFQNEAKEYGHPLPLGEEVYGAWDPDSNQVRLNIYATEWSDESWSLTVLYRDENKEVIRFSTLASNSPRHWVADKFNNDKPSESTLMQIKELGPRINTSRSMIWIDEVGETRDSHPVSGSVNYK